MSHREHVCYVTREDSAHAPPSFSRPYQGCIWEKGFFRRNAFEDLPNKINRLHCHSPTRVSVGKSNHWHRIAYFILRDQDRGGSLETGRLQFKTIAAACTAGLLSNHSGKTGYSRGYQLQPNPYSTMYKILIILRTTNVHRRPCSAIQQTSQHTTRKWTLLTVCNVR